MIEALSDKIFERGCLSCLAIWWRFCSGQDSQDMMDHILRSLPATKYLLSFTLDGNDWLAEIELYILQKRRLCHCFSFSFSRAYFPKRRQKEWKAVCKTRGRGGAASRGLLANWDSECQWSEPIQFRIHINVASQTHCPIIKWQILPFQGEAQGEAARLGSFSFHHQSEHLFPLWIGSP